ncbi:MAG: hypothetical protein KF758_14735 [Anaerolineales bacterium]|nr:hypothetical protein [Anaerolineales bacterium]MBX3038165.1 hypothetical protein [Anaerolineales bacterium]
MKNKYKKPQTDIQPWTWHRAWGITLPIPRTRDGEKLLAEGNISLKQAVTWIIFASAIYTLLTTSPSLIKNLATISLSSILILIGSSFLAGLLSPIGFVLLTAFIHGVSKLFGSKGVWQNFFIVYIAYNAPIMILFGIAVFIYQVFSLKFALFLGPLLSFYWLLVIGPVTIKVNYRFQWLSAFLINFFAMAIFFFSVVGLYIVFNPSILQR